MKTIFPLFLLLLLSCAGTGKGYRLSKIAENEIELAEIKKNPQDTVSVQLTKEEIATLVSIVRDSPAEPRKALPNYWILIRLTNDSVITFKVLDHYIGEKDWYVETDQAAYFKKRYETSKKSPSVVYLKF